MKYFIVVGVVCFILFFITFLLWRVPLQRCASQYESDAQINAQSQYLFTNNQVICVQSYETLTQWDLCQNNIHPIIPKVIRSFVSPIVTNFMIFFRDQKMDIDVYKHNHDERCKGYIYLMFYPPGLE